MHYVYVLRPAKGSYLYVGYTTDLKRRVSEHQNDQSAYTRGRGPWELVYFEAYKDMSDARERERMLKEYGSSLGHLRKRIARSLGK